jgi:hypothetical protein
VLARSDIATCVPSTALTARMTIALDGPVFCRQNVLFWLVRGAGQAGGRQCSFDLVVRAVTARPRTRRQP